MFWNFDLVSPQDSYIWDYFQNKCCRDKTKERIQKTEILEIWFEKIDEEKNEELS